jgi:hypothetical protein
MFFLLRGFEREVARPNTGCAGANVLAGPRVVHCGLETNRQVSDVEPATTAVS